VIGEQWTSDWFHVYEVEECLWARQGPYQDAKVNCYLFADDKQAILVDTGRGEYPPDRRATDTASRDDRQHARAVESRWLLPSL